MSFERLLVFVFACASRIRAFWCLFCLPKWVTFNGERAEHLSNLNLRSSTCHVINNIVLAVFSMFKFYGHQIHQRRR